MKVLVTGGAGYLGSITRRRWSRPGHTPVMLDSLLVGPRSSPRTGSSTRATSPTGRSCAGSSRSIPTSRRPSTWRRGSSCRSRSSCPTSTTATTSPSRWSSSTSSMQLGKPRILFSSTASLYALTAGVRGAGDGPGRADVAVRADQADDGEVPGGHRPGDRLRAIILRYFNPIGTDPDLETGYHLKDATHVVPLLAQTALGYPRVVHDHRHRPADPRRHGHPRLHPRLGPRAGPRARGRGVRRGASRPRVRRTPTSTSAAATA